MHKTQQTAEGFMQEYFYLISSSEQKVNLQNVVKDRNKPDIKDGITQTLKVLDQMLFFLCLAFF